MVEVSSIDLEGNFLAKKTRWATAYPHKFGGDGRSRTYSTIKQVGYSHPDVHTSHLRILARLEGFEPPPDRVETGRSKSIKLQAFGGKRSNRNSTHMSHLA